MLPALITTAAAFLLVFAGVAHTRDRSRLRGVLRVQALLPRRTWVPVSTLLGPVELVIGAAALLRLPASLPVQAALYTAFTLYLCALVSRHVPRLGTSARNGSALSRVVAPQRDVPCGCLGGGESVGWAIVVRAGVAAVASFLAPTDLPLVEWVLCTAGGFVLAMIVILTSLLASDGSRPSAR